MKALTLHQPRASLVALGVKTIETRSWSTKYRGPLLIHAGAKSLKANVLVGEWRSMRWERGATVSLCRQPSTTPIGEPFLVALPLGAIVASCTLADVVPMVAPGGALDPDRPLDYVSVDREISGDDRGLLRLWTDPVEGPTWKSIEDQRPYGDFAPGRFAWLLEDVKATTERCPACWGEGVGAVCPSSDGTRGCDGSGRCDPIPAKGKQRLWEWNS